MALHPTAPPTVREGIRPTTLSQPPRDDLRAGDNLRADAPRGLKQEPAAASKHALRATAIAVDSRTNAHWAESNAKSPFATMLAMRYHLAVDWPVPFPEGVYDHFPQRDRPATADVESLASKGTPHTDDEQNL